MKTTPKTLDIGTKIYYTGDMANRSGMFEIIARGPGYFVLRELPGGDGRVFKGVYAAQIGHEYHGHCDPRFVTEEAVQAFRTKATRITRSL